MLRSTFLHCPGVGEATERRLWRAGFRDWRDILVGAGHERIRATIEESCRRYDASDWSYFDRAIPAKAKWRAAELHRKRTLFVDIETDGSTDEAGLTVIGTFDGDSYRGFVADENLQEAADHLEQFPFWVTFNGALFDVPMIRRRFTHRPFNHIHLDLRFALHRHGIGGGLKRIEKLFGIERSPETDGLDGWDAVRLWREWRHGSRESLDLLLRYNEEDVRNLKPLLDEACRRERAMIEGLFA